MIYLIAQYWHTAFTWLNLFRYISVRSIGALLWALLFSLCIGRRVLVFLKKWCHAKVREGTPSSHQLKNDTPTMGGVLIALSFITTTLLWANLSRLIVWLFLANFIGFGLLGFWDDWLKITKKRGLSARIKWYSQWLLALIMMTAWYYLCSPSTELCVPFFKLFQPALGIFLIPWGMFILVATSNAVNLTDGLDGLATGPLICNFLTFGLIVYLASTLRIAHYLFIPYAGAGELAVIACALVGSLLGFLWYNTHPAEVFMGDVGSLATGAALAFLALVARQELLIPLAGGIFMLEALSVIGQVLSYRYRGKRIFLMAPVHHHFELLGWREEKITVRFWIISFVLALCTLLTLKMR